MPDYRSISSATSVTTPSFSATKPAGTVQGDLLIAVQSSSSAVGMTISGGSTWQQLLPQFGVTMTYWKFAGASEPSSYTIGHSIASTDGTIAAIVCVMNPLAVDPIAASVSTSTGLPPATPSITPQGVGGVEVRLAVAQSTIGALSWTPPSGYTEIFDSAVAYTGGSSIEMTIAYKKITSAAATGVQNFTTTPATPFSAYGAVIEIPGVIISPWQGWGMPI